MECQPASGSGRKRDLPSSTTPRKLNDHIWELYKPTEEPCMDILFFHGLQFKESTTAYLSTWTCGDDPDQIWPSTWLIEEFPNAHVFSVSYDACMKRTQTQGRFDFYTVTENLIHAIRWADIGHRPMILVGHCFGGLVIKSLCVQAARTHGRVPPVSQSTHDSERFLHNVEGVFFYGTSHRGSDCPLFGKVVASLLGGPLLTYVKALSAESARLDTEFLALRENYKIWHNKIWHIASAGESLSTSWGPFSLFRDVIVPEASARYGDNFCTVAADHFTLCKPSARTSNSFQHLKTFLEGIKPKEEVTRALRQRELRRAFSLDFHKDDRYVPLKDSESAVHSAFNVNTDGRAAVILLHGEAGKGKSTLARAIALHYKEATDNAALFEHVIYLECGPQAEILDKQIKLLQLLGEVTANPQEQARQSAFASNLTILKRLRGLLKDQKLLIIFDDVWNQEFLQRMVDLCGRRIKCLVTSQRGDVCRGLNCSSIPIQIEDIQQEDARKILASHVGFQDHCIPRHLDKIADKMIQGTDRNPLALASIARQIDLKRSDELYEWKAVSKELFKALKSDSLTYIHGKKYPISFWSTMKRSFEFLTKEAQKLLILVGMCDGLSIPEEVIDLLNRSIDVKDGSATFTELRQELDSRGMVKIGVLSKIPPKQRWWSIHSLQKQFIEDIKGARESTFISLGGLPCAETRSTVESEVVREFSISEEDVVITLTALYFDKQFGMRAALKMGITFSRFNNLRRSAIEPVTRLLGQHLDDDWTEPLRDSAKRVFLRYVRGNVLNDDAISDLLGSPISRFAMISALRNIALLVFTSLKNFVAGCSSAEDVIQIQLKRLDQDGAAAGPTMFNRFEILYISLANHSMTPHFAASNSIEDVLRVEIVLRLLISIIFFTRSNPADSFVGLVHLARLAKLIQDQDHFNEEIAGYGYEGITLTSVGGLQFAATELMGSGKLALEKVKTIEPLLVNEIARDVFFTHYLKLSSCCERLENSEGSIPWFEAALRVATFGLNYLAPISNVESATYGSVRKHHRRLAKDIHGKLSLLYFKTGKYEEAAKHKVRSQICIHVSSGQAGGNLTSTDHTNWRIMEQQSLVLAARWKKVFTSLKDFVVGCSSAEDLIQFQLDRLDQNDETASQIVLGIFEIFLHSLLDYSRTLEFANSNSIQDVLRVEVVFRLVISTFFSIHWNPGDTYVGLAHLEKLEKLTQDRDYFNEEIARYGYAGVELTRKGSLQIVTTELVDSGTLAWEKVNLIEPLLVNENARDLFFTHYAKLSTCFERMANSEGSIPWFEAALRVATFGLNYLAPVSKVGLDSEAGSSTTANGLDNVRSHHRSIAKDIHRRLSRMYLKIGKYDEAAKHRVCCVQLCMHGMCVCAGREVGSHYYADILADVDREFRNQFPQKLVLPTSMEIDPSTLINFLKECLFQISKYPDIDLSGFRAETLHFKGSNELARGDVGDCILSLEEANKIYEEKDLLETANQSVALTQVTLVLAYACNNDYRAASLLFRNFQPIMDKYHKEKPLWHLWRSVEASSHLMVGDLKSADKAMDFFEELVASYRLSCHKG